MKKICGFVWALSLAGSVAAQTTTPTDPPASHLNAPRATNLPVESRGGPRDVTPEEAARRTARQKEEITINRAARELLRQDNLDGALAEYRKLQSLLPNSGSTQVLIGNVLFRQGKTEEAIAAYKTALSKSAFAAALAYEALGDLYAAIGREAEAIEAYHQIVYRVPGRDWINSYGQSLQALIQPEGQDWSSSRGTDTDLLMRYALLLSKTGQHAEALQVYQWGLKGLSQEDRRLFALRLSARSFDRRLFEAAAHTAIGRRNRALDIPFADAAIAEYRKALSLRSNFAPAHYLLGNALSMKGRSAEAKAAWQKAADVGRGEVKEAAERALRAF